MGAPWVRMHCAYLNAACVWLADSVGGMRAGSRCWHARCAPWNAGEEAIVSKSMGNRTPGPEIGSGKLGTPCVRMQFANWTPRLWSVDAVVCGLSEEPQAASASAQPMVASARERASAQAVHCVVYVVVDGGEAHALYGLGRYTVVTVLSGCNVRSGMLDRRCRRGRAHAPALHQHRHASGARSPTSCG